MSDTHEAVVYDLDGTLVELAVDWAVVRREVRDLFDGTNVDPGGDLFAMLDRAEGAGLADEVEAAIATHERAGARESRRLPTADELVAESRPVAVCSLNAESACTVALETHDLAAHVDAVVGRDTVGPRKPAPEPLLAALDRLGVASGAAVFVGDTDRDARTAERAGVDFRWVE